MSIEPLPYQIVSRAVRMMTNGVAQVPEAHVEYDLEKLTRQEIIVLMRVLEKDALRIVVNRLKPRPPAQPTASKPM